MAVWLVSYLYGPTLNLFESGTLVSGGWQALHGKHLYSDVFAFYGPLAYLGPAAGAVLVGSAFGAVIWDLVITVGLALSSYTIVAVITGRRWWSLIAPISLLLGGSGTSRTTFALIAIACLLTSYRSEHRAGRWAFLAGLATAAALLWYQDAGAWLLVSAALVGIAGIWMPALRVTRRRLVRFGAGLTLGLAPVVVYLMVTGTLGDWLYYCFYFPNTVYAQRSATGYLSGLIDSWSGLGLAHLAYNYVFYLFRYAFVFGAAVACAVIVCRRAWHGRARVELRSTVVVLTVLAVFAVCELRLLTASLDEAKLADTCPPVVVLTLCLALAHRSRPHQWITRSGAAVAAAVAAVAWIIVWPVQAYEHRLAHSTASIGTWGHGRLGGMPLVSAAGPTTSEVQLQDLIDAIDRLAPPGSKIFVAPDAPYLYYLAGRANVAKYDYLDPVYTSASVDHDMAAAIRIGQPSVVILGDNTVAGSGEPGAAIAPQTYRAIDAGYRSEQQIGRWKILVRR